MVATAWNLKKLMEKLKEKFLQFILQLFFQGNRIKISRKPVEILPLYFIIKQHSLWNKNYHGIFQKLKTISVRNLIQSYQFTLQILPNQKDRLSLKKRQYKAALDLCYLKKIINF